MDACCDSQNKNREDSIWYERKQWAKQFGESNEYAADKLNRPKGLHLSNVKLAIRFAVGIELLKRLLWMQIYKFSKGCTRCDEQQCEEIKDQVPQGMSPTLGSPPVLCATQCAEGVGGEWLSPEATLQIRYDERKKQAARQTGLALESEGARIVVKLHTWGIYPSYDRVDSLLPDGMRGAYIEEIVRENREMLGIPKHHAATSKEYLPP